MGGGSSKNYKPPVFNHQKWKKVQIGSRVRFEYGQFQVYRNILTGEEVESYSLWFNSQKEYERYIESFQWRASSQWLVGGRYLTGEKAEWCSGGLNAKVYIERIPIRLSHIRDIPHPQNLYLLSSALQGFGLLFNSIGGFRIVEDLICMDRDGRVKVWLNPDLSRNYLFGGSWEGGQGEQEMVLQILQMIQRNSSLGQFQSVSDYVQSHCKILSFQGAKMAIAEYCQEYGVEIPNYFESVIDIPQEGQFSQEEKSRIERVHYENPNETYSNGFNSEIFQKLGENKYEEQLDTKEQRDKNIQGYRSNSFGLKAGQLNGPIGFNFRIPSPKNAQIQSKIVSNKILPYETDPNKFQPYKNQFNQQKSQLFNPNLAFFKSSTPPRISFNYVQNNTKPSFIIPSHQINLPLSPTFGNIHSKGGSDSKIIYSDSTESYELDAEIAEDLIKYFK